MEKIVGKSAFAGVAMGEFRELKKDGITVRSKKVEDYEGEILRLEDAVKITNSQLQELYDKTTVGVGTAEAAIFEVHQMMLMDEAYQNSIIAMIKNEKENAPYAVKVTGENFSKIFAAAEDEYMKGRAADIKDVSERLIAVLCGAAVINHKLDKPVIIAADDIMPSETVQLEKENVLAFVTRKGSVNSHTAILARTMNIPAIVCAPLPKDIDGKNGIIDGNSGIVYIEPEETVKEEYTKLQEKESEKKTLLRHLKGKKTLTSDGKEIKLFANIGSLGDMEAVLENDAEGVGLFRSEFIYLEAADYPTEEEQFQIYKDVAQRMEGKKVIFRTLDIGADKQTDYFGMEKEDNPALGYRAIRICLTQEDIFRIQLRALLRASAYGNIAIMIPMVVSLWEVHRTKQIVEELKEELNSRGVCFGEIELGIMIETPAAVMIADLLAKEVNFFSIGTNDLTQYTLAIDRQNAKLDMFYDAHHPAILRMIQRVIECAHKEGIWVGICGELAADKSLTRTFVRMGIDELSVAPGCILPIRKKIIEM
ncbi:phosphoenolpyruvate--protein phosphotransferase [Lactonifactor longoviformis]|uniref:Phosphoenolpyruvate-protein phosphotransferase n=1 Tax=Lactonifactor longoviformis DSM 17459 TaxID=1122155 RepID=A0A1M4UQJ4_9CLOT|nr:phosphoenolpyruvate--protein phosphotransferase [Lactonifactor longoviformis]POP30714.1 phosphoenolpyruvate--protein phosphotransferase [Lactonifactor longoviformis]SHE59011.1 phosphotransferase system, enzyme I, PtsI [Lactonifactor longoviformis DSM 17459]